MNKERGTPRDALDVFLRGMNDDELTEWLERAEADLAKVAEEAPDSEWHERCFAAVVILVEEMSARGLRINKNNESK